MPKKNKEELSLSEKKERLLKLMAEKNREYKDNVLKFAKDEPDPSRTLFDIKSLDELTGGLPCFIAGTKIVMHDYSLKNIEKIKVGEEVLAFDEKYKLQKSEVVEINENETKEIVFTKTNNHEIISTKKHPFLTVTTNGIKKWVEARFLNSSCMFYDFPQFERNQEWKKGWILGSILGDGSLYKTSFNFNNNNLSLIEKFRNNVFDIYNLETTKEKLKDSGMGAKCFRISFNSIGICNVLHYQVIQLYNNINCFNEDFLRGFVGGFYDSEGCSSSIIRMYNTNLQLLNVIKTLLDSYFGFSSIIYKMSDYKKAIIKNKEYDIKPEFFISANKTLKFLFTFLPYSKNLKEISLHGHTLDKQRVLFKIIKQKRKDRIQKSCKVYNIGTTLNTYIANGFPVHNSKRFSIIWGDSGTGKTTLAYKIIGQAQKNKKLCAYIDLERSYDENRAKQFGVNPEELVLANAFENAEQAMDTLISMCKEKVIDVCILDSIQALSPIGEQETKKGKEKSLAEDTMALLARKMSQFFRMSSSGVYKGDVTIILIGQSRTDLGGFIAFEKLSGGHALLHWASIILKTGKGPKSESPTEKIILEERDEDGKPIKIERIVGFQSIIRLDKVKISGTAMQGTEIRLPFLFSTGFYNENVSLTP